MKRIIVLMLACLMLLSVVPFSVFAEEDVHENEVETEETTEQVECPNVEDTTKSHAVKAVTTKAPQCGERGYTLYSCECGAMFLGSYVEADPDEDHKWEVVEGKEGKAPTCNKPGVEATEKCSVCGTTKGGKTLDATGKHVYVLNATTGEEICECGTPKPESDCESEDANEAKDHNWDYETPKSTVAPTCNTTGTITFGCKNEGCTETKTVAVAATGNHDFGDLIKAKAATCTESGFSTPHYVCSTCNQTFGTDKKTVLEAEDYIEEALGHVYSCTVTTATTTCSRCNKTVNVVAENATHNVEGNRQKKDPTCTAYGYLVEICVDCGKKVTDEIIEPNGHEIGETADEGYAGVHKPGEEDKACAPLYNRYTCEYKGTDKCGGDGYEWKVVATAKDHDYEENVVIQEATCTLKKTTASVCKVCGEQDASSIVEYEIDADNHVEVDVALKTADCALGGKVIISCTKCAYVSSEVIAAETDHVLEYDYIEGEEPDCENGGFAEQTCKYCEAMNEDSVAVDKLNHTGGTLVRTDAATCVKGEVKYYEGVCTREGCTSTIADGGYTIESDVKNDANEFESKAAANAVHGKTHLIPVTTGDQANDCTQGLERYTCNAEGCALNGQVIIVYNASEAHTYEDYDCTAENTICAACKKEESKIEAVATEHDMKVVINDSTCTAYGTITFTCQTEGCTVKVVFDKDTDFDDEVAFAEGTLNKKLLDSDSLEDVDVAATIAMKAHTRPETIQESTASCLTNGGKEAVVCTVCNFEIEEAEVYEALGHSYAPKAEGATPSGDTVRTVVLGCENAAYVVIGCTECDAEVVINYVAATGHVNKDKEVIVPSCTDTVEDRVCVNANCCYEENKVPTHAVDLEVKDSTCTTQGYEIEVCTECGEILDTRLVPGYGEHNYIKGYEDEAQTKPIYNEKVTPAIFKDGKIEYVCTGCGYIDDEMTKVITVEETHGEDTKVLGLTLAVDNANKAGAGFSDSSIVAVTVNLGSIEDIAVWGVNFNLEYDATKLVFVGHEFAADSVFTGYASVVNNIDKAYQKISYTPDYKLGANDYITYDEDGDPEFIYKASKAVVKIGANVANDENGKTVNAIVNGEELAIVTLYFEVSHFVEAEQIENTTKYDVVDTFDQAFQIVKNSVVALDKDAEEVYTAEEGYVALDVEKYLDVNADGAVTYADVLAMWKMISGETEAEYNVVADVDKNGIVEAKDFMDLYAYVLGELDYEDMVAIAAAE